MDLYTSPTYFIDSDSALIQDFARNHTKRTDSPVQKAISLYYAVRDGWKYNPYSLRLNPDSFKASFVLQEQEAHCLTKAILLAAALRHVSIPSRLHFYQVRNHLGTSRLEELLQSNVLVFHGATELYLDHRWRTVTPAFNRELCDKLGVPPLEFDGFGDAIFQPYAREKGKFMEYLYDYGAFHDLPFELMVREFHQKYGDVINEFLPGDSASFLFSDLDQAV